MKLTVKLQLLFVVVALCVVYIKVTRDHLFSERFFHDHLYSSTSNYPGPQPGFQGQHDVPEPRSDFENLNFQIIHLTERELVEILQENCGRFIDDVEVQLDNYINTTLPVSEYKRQLAYNFTQKYCNPPHKMKTPGTFKSYEGFTTPDPAKGMPDANEHVDIEKINNHIKMEKLSRLKFGDDDILTIPEVQEELSNNNFKVPNIIHFIWFGANRRLRVDQIMAVIAALRYQKPKLILFHYDAEPIGEYWDIVKKVAGSTLRLVKRTAPTEVYGQPVKVIQHVADVARIEILTEVGGIYLDTDSIVLKSVDEFRNYDMVMPQPSDGKVIANSIIFASPDSWFLRRWYHEYKQFDDRSWSYNSLNIPSHLVNLFPDTIHITTKVLCRPNYDETDLIYRNIVDWSPVYIMHLYSRMMKAKDGREERPLKQLAVLNTTYGQVARHVIWGDKKIRDVTDWIVTCDLEAELTRVPINNESNPT